MVKSLHYKTFKILLEAAKQVYFSHNKPISVKHIADIQIVIFLFLFYYSMVAGFASPPNNR